MGAAIAGYCKGVEEAEVAVDGGHVADVVLVVAVAVQVVHVVQNVMVGEDVGAAEFVSGNVCAA